MDKEGRKVKETIRHTTHLCGSWWWLLHDAWGGSQRIDRGKGEGKKKKSD